MNFNEILSMETIYWCGRHSDVELLHLLSIHGNALPYMERIMKIRNEGIAYANQQFDVLASAASFLYREGMIRRGSESQASDSQSQKRITHRVHRRRSL